MIDLRKRQKFKVLVSPADKSDKCLQGQITVNNKFTWTSVYGLDGQ